MSALSVAVSPVLTAPDWNALVARTPEPTFLQSWEWGELQRALGVPYWRLVLGSAEQPAGVALVVRRRWPLGRSWLYVPRGPLLLTDAASPHEPWHSFTEQLHALSSEAGTIFMRCDPPWPPTQHQFLQAHQWRKAEREVQPQHTLVLDVSLPEDELQRAMHAKTRYNIRLAERQGVTVRFSREPAAIDLFLELAREVSGRSEFQYHPPAYYRAMHTALAPSGLLEVAIAEYQGRPLAVHLLVTFAGTTTYVHGASSSRERSRMAPHLLQWESIRRAKAAGSRTYDFFGIAPPDAPPTHPWAGITRFKTSFGGRRRSYVGAYDLVLEPALYAAFAVARRARRWWR